MHSPCALAEYCSTKSAVFSTNTRPSSKGVRLKDVFDSCQ